MGSPRRLAAKLRHQRGVDDPGFQALVAASATRGFLQKSDLSAREIREVPGHDGTTAPA